MFERRGPVSSRRLAPESLSLRQRRSFQLFLLAVAAFASDYGRNAVGPLQELMRGALALNDNQVALLQGTALGLPQVIAAIPLGLVVDRYQRGHTLLVLAAVNVLGSALTALASSFTLLFFARCLIGFAVTATGPAAYSLMGDLYPPGRRGYAAMAFNVGGCAGMSAVFSIGGALAGAAGSGAAGWRWAMLWLGGPLLLALLLMLGMREPARTDQIVKSPSVRQACAELWGCRALFGLLMTGWGMVQIGNLAAVVWTAPTLSRDFGLSPTRIGQVVGAAFFLSGVLGPVAGGLLADWQQRTAGPRRTMATLVPLALLSVLASAFPIAPGIIAASGLLFLFAMLGTAISTMSMTLTIVVIPNELRGLCIALYTVVGALGMGIAPLAVSILSSHLGGAGMIGKSLAAVSAATAVLAAVAFALGRQYIGGGVVQCAQVPS
jgi:MFS family permease